MKISLENKKTIVCGSTKGIGYAIAKNFSEIGAKVTLIARNEKKLKKTIDSLSGNGHDFITADFSNPKELEKKN